MAAKAYTQINVLASEVPLDYMYFSSVLLPPVFRAPDTAHTHTVCAGDAD